MWGKCLHMSISSCNARHLLHFVIHTCYLLGALLVFAITALYCSPSTAAMGFPLCLPSTIFNHARKLCGGPFVTVITDSRGTKCV